MASNVKVNKITPTSACGTITLGDSGDTISIPSGASLSIGGSVSGIEGIVNWDTTAKTTGFTAVAGNGYFVNTTSGAITVTLPATPTAGDLVAVKDYALTAQTNNITLGRNGSNIQGVANDFIINTQGRSVTLIYVDGTQGWLLTGASQASDITIENLFVAATGGCITTCGDYKIHKFTGPGTFTVTNTGPGSSTVDYLVLAGGAGGGYDRGGGGGAGGFRESKAACAPWTASPLASATSLPVSVTGYPITVGAGGPGGPGTPPSATADPNNQSGSNSVFSTITSTGGGGGMNSNVPIPQRGIPGGSGGGGAGSGIPGCGNSGSGNTPPVSPPQGTPGGNGFDGPAPSVGGGGGGAGNAGSPANSGGAGDGGIGVQTSISGAAIRYAGGGGGGSPPIYPGGPAGNGGAFPGLPGAEPQANRYGGGTGTFGGTAASGLTNTGAGGGGNGDGNSAGGAGGSGVVIIRYKYQ